jgi:hypothetical protein
VSGTVLIDTTFTVAAGGTMQLYKSPARPAALINCVLPANKGQPVAWCAASLLPGQTFILKTAVDGR